MKSTNISPTQISEHLLKSYQIGLEKSIQKSSTDDFYNDWQTFIQTQLPLTDQLIFPRLNKIRVQGINAARQGNFMVAEKCLNFVRLRLLIDRLSDQGSLISESLLKAAESYLDYKHDHFDKARKKTFEALTIYLNIEEDFGYEIIFLRRLQLVCNLIRLEGRAMNYKRAIELACHLLNYLQGNSEVISIPGSWGYERVARQSPKIISTTYALIVGEIAEILVGKPHQLEKELFEIISAELKLHNNVSYHCHQGAYLWLLIKQVFVNENIPQFEKMTFSWLSEGRRDTPLLWYATVIDSINLLEKLNIPESKLFKQKVIRDANSWQNCPPYFLSLLDDSFHKHKLQKIEA